MYGRYLKKMFDTDFRDENEPLEIVDADAEKPDGWLDDEENLIPDPDAEKPDDW